MGDSMDALQIFSHNLKKLRIQKGFSQKEIAEISGLHRTYISAIECGKRSIALDNVQKIADALGVQPYQLFLINNNNTKTKEV
jgi:transcriptional regulator with XRE-family HTH domain